MNLWIFLVVNRFFLYGTLLAGQCRRPLAERFGLTSLGRGTVEGWLLHLGEYPGLVDDQWFLHTGTNRPESHVSRQINGEVVELRLHSEALLTLDQEEECWGSDADWDGESAPQRAELAFEDGLYVRRARWVNLAAGGGCWAWVYHYNARPTTIRWIESGDWLRDSGGQG
jgi:gamma-glutamylcyclotransferase (GGCT)/AIG2-like uncharacterized protein YtfP